ncbi:helix-turn-helix transcriptional regulator [Sphingomonas sp. VNH70]|uniref:helix-turn-helix transcriptional regulator n=1 Tax=Sphingomonas silueang TaxID=3156617 RepID=UPI0032B4F28D
MTQPLGDEGLPLHGEGLSPTSPGDVAREVMVQIEHIYDAAFDRARFAGLIEQLVRAFDAQSGFLAFSGPGTLGFQAQYGNEPVWLERYMTTYAGHDVLRPMLTALPEGVCSTAAPLLARPEVRDSIFYREYLAPQGIVDNLAVNLIVQPGLSAHLALIRRDPAPLFDAADETRLTLLTPHLRRAVYIQSRLIRAADHLAAIRSLIGDADGALLMLDAQARVVDFDPAVAAMLAVRLGETLGETVAGRGIAVAMQSGQPLAVETTAPDGSPVSLLLQARALDRGRFGELGDVAGTAWVVHLTRIDRPRPIAMAAIGAFYGLTPTELRVLGDAITHGDLAGIGGRLGMARATARTHLHRIYEKTGTGGFAALSSLVHRFARVTPAPSENSPA